MKTKNVVVVCHNIRSRHNIGAIFRTADSAGVNKIFLCGITPTPPHSKIEKVSLGAENFVPWEQCKQTWRLIEKLKKEGYQIVALEQTNTSTPYNKFKPKSPIVLILGSETEGLPESIIKRCNKVIDIPMLGKKKSLNVSVAFGIAIYEISL